MCLWRGERLGEIETDGNDKGIVADAMIGVEPRDPVDQAFANVEALAHLGSRRGARTARHGLADAGKPVGIIAAETRADDVIETGEDDYPAGTEIDRFMECRQLGGGQREDDDAEECPILGVDAPGNLYRGFSPKSGQPPAFR